ncbi:MAG: VOC family protein [Acidobacteria bacterium]|nr:VOC family protein [Acidobacteriota bacterium]
MGKTGGFNWVDLMSTDAAGSKEFYAKLFDWTATDVQTPDGSVYALLSHDGDLVAGLGEHSSEMIERGVPSVWASYVTVDDVGASVAKVEGLGGTVVRPEMEIPGSGTMAVINDPTGATVAMWQDGGHTGADKFNTPNSLTWNELLTRDPSAATEFYSAMFGWTFDPMEGADPAYNIIINDGAPNGGVMDAGSVLPDGVPNMWGVYFSVADADATAQAAVAAGGSIVREPFDAPGVGRIVIIADPQGAVFSAIVSVPQE